MDHTLTVGSAIEAGFDETQLERIRQRAETWVDGIKTRALVLLAARDGDVVLNEAWGTRTPGRDAEAISADTLFHTGSISKVVTATAVMLLAERGFLGVNRPVKDYVPELKAESSEEIKVWHLLCHTSGYSDDICGPARRAHVETKLNSLKMPEQEATEDPITRLGLHAGNVEKLAFEPGKQMEYCNYNFELLGELVRRASGQPFKAFVEQEIFHPLGMKNSFMGISEVELGRVALRGEGDFHEVFDREWAYLLGEKAPS